MKSFKELFAPRDMSEGTPWKCIATFAIPMIIGNFAQQLYNTVDTIVVGNSRWGTNALAAVSSAFPVLNLLLALFIGIATGAGIMVAQYFGAKDREGLGKTIANCGILAAVASVLIMIVGPMITEPLLTAIGTLPELYEDCRTYLIISFLGIFGFFAYNIFGGILRGMGDSFSSLRYLLVTTVLNIIGDVLLVDKLGVAGVAYATIFAQGVSAILCIRKVLSLKEYFVLTKAELKPDMSYIKRILGLGLPSGISSALMSVSGILVQALNNSFLDANYVAASALTIRVDGYAIMPTMSFGMAMSTYVGQNIGAGKMDRVKVGLEQCIKLALCVAIVMTPAVLFGGPYLLKLFTPDMTVNKMTMGLIYILCPSYIVNSFGQPMMGVLRGAGDTVSPMWISIFTNIVLRLITAYGFVYIARSAGWELFTQERMVFVSMQVCMYVSVIMTFFVYKRGKWKEIRVMQRGPKPVEE